MFINLSKKGCPIVTKFKKNIIVFLSVVDYKGFASFIKYFGIRYRGTFSNSEGRSLIIV